MLDGYCLVMVGCVYACDCLSVVVLVWDMVRFMLVLAGAAWVLLGFSVLLMPIGLAFALRLIDGDRLGCLWGVMGVTCCLIGCLP